ncbi:hypothetical protein GE061_000250 [Apolygus lucorum]|uniref:ATP-dependent DNA helicase n=1 Tax=Apolygus lucorum TaxID=248454 RepID=A0A8S9Y7V5_APOLU|nr:hypothetical protein GE061_000250 [Apolygus lucorum]
MPANANPMMQEKLLDKPFQRLKDKAAVYGSSFSPSRWLSYLSVWDENDLLFEGETAEACFLRRQNELRPLKGNLSAEQFAHMEAVIQQAIAQAVALNTGRLPNDAEPRNFLIPNLAPDEEILINDPNDFCEEPIPTSVMPDDVYLTSVQHLNIQQKNLFHTVSSSIEKDIAKQDNQLLLFITGGAGSGKSFLLKLIVEHIKRCYGPTVDILLKPQFVEVGSLTGVAARQVFGRTLHSIFSLPVEKGITMDYRAMSGHRLEQERRKWRHINWLIIDEISMVSYQNLRIIHLRLQEFKNNTKLFGGVNVLLFGDIMQLPPVKGNWCYQQPPWFSAEINLWRGFSFCELTINMRQRNDTEFIDLLNNLRFGGITISQLELLCQRRRVPLIGEFQDGLAVRIYPTLKLVEEYNTKMSAEFAKSQRMYVVNAIDESREAATYGKRPPSNVIPVDVNNCGGLLHTISISEGSRVMLRRNISISNGLVNGAMGIVAKFRKMEQAQEVATDSQGEGTSTPQGEDPIRAQFQRLSIQGGPPGPSRDPDLEKYLEEAARKFHAERKEGKKARPNNKIRKRRKEQVQLAPQTTVTPDGTVQVRQVPIWHPPWQNRPYKQGKPKPGPNPYKWVKK